MIKYVKRPSNKRLDDAIAALRSHKIMRAIRILRTGNAQSEVER
jgi:hypothetical protein